MLCGRGVQTVEIPWSGLAIFGRRFGPAPSDRGGFAVSASLARKAARPSALRTAARRRQTGAAPSIIRFDQRYAKSGRGPRQNGRSGRLLRVPLTLRPQRPVPNRRQQEAQHGANDDANDQHPENLFAGLDTMKTLVVFRLCADRAGVVPELCLMV